MSAQIAGVTRAPCFALALAADAAGALSCLSAAERTDYVALRTDARRRDWLAGRLAAKRAVACALSVHDLARVELAARPGAAPHPMLRAADGDRLPLPLALSITHCDGRAAAAVGAEWVRLGVDLERRGGVAPRRQSYFLSAAERARAGVMDTTSLWALKEAAWKALGCGDELPFRALELRLDEAGRVRAVACHGAEHDACAAFVDPWPGYVLAVCSVEAPVGAVGR